MKNLLVLLVVVCASSTALAETYLCITKAAAAVLNENGKWRGTGLSGEGKFILKEKKWFAFGIDTPEARCEDHPKVKGILACEGFAEVMFNKKNLRYRRVHHFGYVEDEDFLNTLTPSIEIGNCSRID